jgi:hypothetical protein
LEGVESLSQKYVEAKKELFNTRHGTLAAQKIMKDLANIHETNPTHLRRVLQSSSLGSSEDFASTESDLVRRYESARFNTAMQQYRESTRDPKPATPRED